MKLYFYILNTYSGSGNSQGLWVKECEAEEKAKTYKAVDGAFPNYYRMVSKTDIGRIIDSDYLFLTEPNFEYAKEVFRNRVEERIANKLEEIEKLKAELKIINESEV